MRKFLFKSFLFLLPPIFLLGFPFVVLLRSGELVMPEQIISLGKDQHKNVLYGTAYGGYIKPLKVATTLKQQPEILALGDSRISQIRSQFFNPNVKFYNASLIVSNLSDFRTFLSFIPTTTQPKILFVDINQQFFNEATYKSGEQEGKRLMSQPGLNDEANIFISNWTHVYKHLLEGKYSLRQVFQTPPQNVKLLGLEAAIQLKGFRNDGSYYDGQYVLGRAPMPVGYDFAAMRQWIATGSDNLAWGQKISPEALAELDAFLSECDERGIYVAGILAPFPHEFYQLMKDSGHYGYFFQVPEAVRPIFAKHNFEFYDFSDFAFIGASDSEALDGAHGSEKTYLRLFINMLNHNSKLGQYADAKRLAQDLKNAPGNLEVYQDNFTGSR